MVRVEIRKTSMKALVACIQFPKSYSDEPILIDIKSRILPNKLLQKWTSIAEEEAKKVYWKIKYLGKTVDFGISSSRLSYCVEEKDVCSMAARIFWYTFGVTNDPLNVVHLEHFLYVRDIY